MKALILYQPYHLNRLTTFERARLGMKLRAAFDRDHERAGDVFFRGNDVANPKADQVRRRNVRFRQINNNLNDGIAQLAANPLNILGGRRFLGVANPIVG